MQTLKNSEIYYEVLGYNIANELTLKKFKSYKGLISDKFFEILEKNKNIFSNFSEISNFFKNKISLQKDEQNLNFKFTEILNIFGEKNLDQSMQFIYQI